MTRPRFSSFSFVLASSACVALAACGGSDSNAPPAAAPNAGSTTTPAASPADVDAKLAASLAGPQRTEKERARDKYRHPRETLEFFGLKPSMTVIELSPGSGWYSAVLAPVLKDQGKLIVAGGDPKGDPKSEGTKNAQALQQRFAAMPDVFAKVQPIVLKHDGDWNLGADGSADMVLTFRNFHNWVEAKMTDKVLASVSKVLKHGGVLGIVDHRAKEGGSTDPNVIGDSGYIPEAEVIRIVTAAGFKLDGKSDVNANPKDTKDYPKGVWTLPPTYEMNDVDRAKYDAIGESDRMTLKFVKP